jgi:hypothetical protein
MSHHLPSFRPAAAGDARRGATRAPAITPHEREVRLVRESLWRRPQARTGTRRGS